jgi:hemerythrin-like metal-binding protein/PAS domain S-box-containing protein
MGPTGRDAVSNPFLAAYNRAMPTLSPSLIEAAPAILEASSEAIINVEVSGKILGCNNHFKSLVGVVEEKCVGLNISRLMPELDLQDGSTLRQDAYEPCKLMRLDGTSNWVLAKVIRVGTTELGYRTILIQDPEAVRRIIDRLDFIDSYDLKTGLYNRRKGILEFEQLQASNLKGGCFLLSLSICVQGQCPDIDLARVTQALKTHLLSLGNEQVAARLSSCEFFFLYSDDEVLSEAHCLNLLAAMQQDASLSGLSLELAFCEWSGTQRSPTSIVETLRSQLAPIDNPERFLESNFSESRHAPASFLDTLAAALDNNELVFFIQPQINTENRLVASGELLIRWTPTADEVILPSQFIDYLEEGPFADRFLAWSIEETVRILQRIKRETGDWIILSLNVAPNQFRESLLVDALIAACNAGGVPTEYIEVEITERILAVDHKQVLGVLKQLQRQGFKIAIDDFGTGYSSLSYLRMFPLDRLKIDRVFVTNLADNEEDRLISSAIASLAHVLGLEVVVEGVEKPEQASFLQTIGCEYFQGFLTGKPMPIDAFIHFYQQQKQDLTLIERTLEGSTHADVDQKSRLVTWKKSFSTDLVSVDNEHRDLIDALNQFTESYLNDPESVCYLDAIDLIGAETIKHFDHEEQAMRNISYPRYETHKEKHKSLIADLSKRRAEIEKDPSSVDFDEVLRYLKFWLLRHLISEDTHLHRHINRSSTENRNL